MLTLNPSHIGVKNSSCIRAGGGHFVSCLCFALLIGKTLNKKINWNFRYIGSIKQGYISICIESVLLRQKHKHFSIFSASHGTISPPPHLQYDKPKSKQIILNMIEVAMLYQRSGKSRICGKPYFNKSISCKLQLFRIYIFISH